MGSSGDSVFVVNKGPFCKRYVGMGGIKDRKSDAYEISINERKGPREMKYPNVELNITILYAFRYRNRRQLCKQSENRAESCSRSPTCCLLCNYRAI